MTTATQPAAKSKRRWFQFSLRMLLVGTAVTALILAVGLQWIVPAQRQRAAVKRIKSLNGKVFYNDAPPEEIWLVNRLRDWLPRDYFDQVSGVAIVCQPLAEADLVNLKDLKSLKQLSLCRTVVTDDWLLHLKGHATLERLALADTRVTDAGLVHLKELSALRELYLFSTWVSRHGVADFNAALPNCQIHGP